MTLKTDCSACNGAGTWDWSDYGTGRCSECEGTGTEVAICNLCPPRECVPATSEIEGTYYCDQCAEDYELVPVRVTDLGGGYFGQMEARV